MNFKLHQYQNTLANTLGPNNETKQPLRTRITSDLRQIASAE